MSAPPGPRSPGAAISRATATSGLQGADEAKGHSTERSDNLPTDPQDALALFGATVERNAYGRTTTFYMPEQDHRRGPGQPAPTTGPEDARAPRYWIVEAEQIVIALVESGHRVTSDDLHERFADEPSATGAAIGGLFKSMSSKGLLRLVGHRPSSRPEARGRVVGIWAAGVPS